MAHRDSTASANLCVCEPMEAGTAGSFEKSKIMVGNRRKIRPPTCGRS
jgi:hypothetical protein